MSYTEQIKSHYDKLLEAAGKLDSAMWPAAVDIKTGEMMPEDHVPPRVYRQIGAPAGSSFYWDQPMVVGAIELSVRTGNEKYKDAACAYTKEFLRECIAENGMFQWGNHQYYDLLKKEVIEFHNGYHELRPITPAWDLLGNADSVQTEKYIMTMGERHVYDFESGGFNRHDDGQKGHAFIEAGGILCESLVKLWSKTDNQKALDLALKIARYSYGHCHPETGLLINEPDFGRWDSKVATTETGLWAMCLDKAYSYSLNEEFLEMGAKAVKAYLQYGYDKTADRYFGQLSTADGQPVIPAEQGYWPGKYSDPWNIEQWPMHDYAVDLARACLEMGFVMEDEVLIEGVHNWARIIMDMRPAETGSWAYAESYGKAIHFLLDAGRLLGEDTYIKDAEKLGQEAVESLFRQDMFQGYPDSGVYETVDGVGYLILSLLFLENQKEPDMWGFRF